MKNTIEVDGYKAIVEFDPETEVFRGSFLELNGGADFYATSVRGLISEGKKSLKAFLDLCEERGLEPRKSFSGRFMVRLPQDLHARIATAAEAEGKSLNRWVADTLKANA